MGNIPSVEEILLSERNLDAESPWLERLGVAPSEASRAVAFDRSAVAVVGNGAFGEPRGQEIDAFPTVVRFNGFKTKGFEEMAGSKTTIHVLNSQNLALARPNPAGPMYLLIDTCTPARMFEFYFANLHRVAGLQIVRPSLYRQLGCLLHGRYKTQGYFFIELARLHFDSVAIAGFSGQNHYFDARWKMYAAHPLEAEHQKYAAWESPTFRQLS